MTDSIAQRVVARVQKTASIVLKKIDNSLWLDVDGKWSIEQRRVRNGDAWLVNNLYSGKSFPVSGLIDAKAVIEKQSRQPVRLRTAS